MPPCTLAKNPSKSQAENPKLDTMGESKAQKMCRPSLNSCQFFYTTIESKIVFCVSLAQTKLLKGREVGRPVLPSNNGPPPPPPPPP